MDRSSSKTPEVDEVAQLRGELDQVKRELDEVKRELVITKGQLADSEQKRVAAVGTLKILAKDEEDERMEEEGEDKENLPQVDCIPFIDDGPGKRRESIIVERHVQIPEQLCKNLQNRLAEAESTMKAKERDHQALYRDLLLSIRSAERSRQEAVEAFTKFEKFLDENEMGSLMVEHRQLLKKTMLLAWCQKTLEPTDIRVNNFTSDFTTVKPFAALIRQLFPKLLESSDVTVAEVQSIISSLGLHIDLSFLDVTARTPWNSIQATSVESYIIDFLLAMYKKSTQLHL